MACYIFGAGSYFGLIRRPAPEDTVIAADGGWRICREEGIVPDLLLGDFDSLHTVPDLAISAVVPVEKDDTDMMLAIKEGLARGETDFRLYGGVGGRTDTPSPTCRACCIWRSGAHRAGCTATGSASPPSAAASSAFRPGRGASYPCSAWARTRRA